LVEGVTFEDDPKVALEVLKEWARHLEAKKSASSTEPEPPVMVQLVHAVPRPSRPVPERAASENVTTLSPSS